MKNLIDAYIPTIRRHPTQRVKIPCGTKKPERIQLPKPAKIDRFEIKEYVKNPVFQKKSIGQFKQHFILVFRLNKIVIKFLLITGQMDLFLLQQTFISISDQKHKNKKKNFWRQ